VTSLSGVSHDGDAAAAAAAAPVAFFNNLRH